MFLSIDEACNATVTDITNPKRFWEEPRQTYHTFSKASVYNYLTDYKSIVCTKAQP